MPLVHRFDLPVVPTALRASSLRACPICALVSMQTGKCRYPSVGSQAPRDLVRRPRLAERLFRTRFLHRRIFPRLARKPAHSNTSHPELDHSASARSSGTPRPARTGIRSRRALLQTAIPMLIAHPNLPTPLTRKKPTSVKIHVRTARAWDVTLGRRPREPLIILLIGSRNAPAPPARRAREEASPRRGSFRRSYRLPRCLFQAQPRAQAATQVGNYAIQIKLHRGHSTVIYSYYISKHLPLRRRRQAFRASCGLEHLAIRQGMPAILSASKASISICDLLHTYMAALPIALPPQAAARHGIPRVIAATRPS